MSESTFLVKFQNGDVVEIAAFNAEQAGILAAADRIRAGLVKEGNEHRVESIGWIEPSRVVTRFISDAVG